MTKKPTIKIYIDIQTQLQKMTWQKSDKGTLKHLMIVKINVQGFLFSQESSFHISRSLFNMKGKWSWGKTIIQDDFRIKLLVERFSVATVNLYCNICDERLYVDDFSSGRESVVSWDSYAEVVVRWWWGDGGLTCSQSHTMLLFVGLHSDSVGLEW